MFDLFEEPKKKKAKKPTISTLEWKQILKTHNNKCALCGQSEEKVITLMKAHRKAYSKGGTQVFPLCPHCHNKYDKGKCTLADLKKLGITKAEYDKLQPTKNTGTKPKKKESNTDDWFILQ